MIPCFFRFFSELILILYQTLTALPLCRDVFHYPKLATEGLFDLLWHVKSMLLNTSGQWKPIFLQATRIFRSPKRVIELDTETKILSWENTSSALNRLSSCFHSKFLRGVLCLLYLLRAYTYSFQESATLLHFSQSTWFTFHWSIRLSTLELRPYFWQSFS